MILGDSISKDTPPQPLVDFTPRVLFRDAMLESADSEGKRWYIAFCSENLNSNISAIEAGLGVSLLPVGAIMGHEVIPSPMFGCELAVTLSLYYQSNNRLITITTLVERMRNVLLKRYHSMKNT